MRNRTVHILLSALLFLTTSVAYPQSGISYKILDTFDRMFYNSHNPRIEVKAYNNTDENCKDQVDCIVRSYNGESLYCFTQQFSIAPGDSALLSFSFPVRTGFYRVSLERNGEVFQSATMGYEPERLPSRIDTSSAVKELWGNALKELAAIPHHIKFEKVKQRGAKDRNLYSVKFSSFGEETIEAFYCEPKKGGLYPVYITALDKNEPLAFPDESDERIELIVKPRTWVSLKDDNYYVGAVMDMIRAIDVVQKRRAADLKNIFMKGEGIGGAFALGASALDHRIAAVTVYAPAITNKRLQGDDVKYDIKNLSVYIESPVLMGIGLEDNICNPILNYELYNPIKSLKEYYLFVDGHKAPKLWRELEDNFCEKHKR